MLQIEDIDLEMDVDFLTIYDGRNPSAPVLAQLTGSQLQSTTATSARASPPSYIISSQSHVYVYFVSSVTHARRGFSLVYKAGCDWVVCRSHGVLTSPGMTLVPYPSRQFARFSIESQRHSSSPNRQLVLDNTIDSDLEVILSLRICFGHWIRVWFSTKKLDTHSSAILYFVFI